MAVYGKKLLDNEGNTILPKTRASLVYTSDDSTVEDKISDIIDGTIQVKEAENAEKAWSADRLIGRAAVYSGNGYWYMHNTGSDIHIQNCIPYFAACTDHQGKWITDYMPKTGGTFSGGVSVNGNFIVNGQGTFNQKVQFNERVVPKTDIAPGNGVYLQPIHIPNISQNIHYVILWT